MLEITAHNNCFMRRSINKKGSTRQVSHFQHSCKSKESPSSKKYAPLTTKTDWVSSKSSTHDFLIFNSIMLDNWLNHTERGKGREGGWREGGREKKNISVLGFRSEHVSHQSEVSFSSLKENSNGPYSDIHTEWIFIAKGMSSTWNKSLVCLPSIPATWAVAWQQPQHTTQ